MAIKFEDRKAATADKPGKAKTTADASFQAPEHAASPAEDGPIGELPFGKPDRVEKKSGRKR